MSIVIIGAGTIGGTLAGLLTAAGHDVGVANARGADSLRALAASTGATAIDLGAVPADTSVVVLAVPPTALPTLRPVLQALPPSTVVVDAGNYVPGMRDRPIEAIEHGESESVWSAEAVGRPVVKAFNTIAAASLRGGGRPQGAPDRIGAPVAGDDAAGKQVVIGLLDDVGFDGFDAGELAASWRQQPGTPVYTADLTLPAARDAIDAARAEDSITWRARVRGEG